MPITPLVLIIMDGWGISPRTDGNAIAQAKTPIMDRLGRDYPHTQLRTSGAAVGLPEGQMGNSEVGHLNIGAGKLVLQEFTRVSKAIYDRSFYVNEALLKAIAHVQQTGGALHLCGLIGDGGVHAHYSHYYALLELAKSKGVQQVYIHGFLDGRDTLPQSGLGYIQQLEQHCHELGLGKIATLSGRYYAMDRDNRWDRVAKAYRAMTRGEGPQVSAAPKALEVSYAATITDEFVLPVVITEQGLPVATVKSGDALIYWNFRSDRGRELTKAFILPNFSGFDRGQQLANLVVVTMTEYEKGLPVDVAFPADNVTAPLAKLISDKGWKQFHTAETEKYAHVTFFFNGGREQPYPNEDRVLVPSPKVATYDLKPEMSASGITEVALEKIASKTYAFVIINFANADMVGHSGIIEAAIQAVETVDTCVGKVVDATLQAGGAALITADHGNAEQMIDYDTGGPFTSHTTNPVPLYFVVPQYKTAHLREGILADVAPTILQLLDLPQPADMTGASLLMKA